MGNQNPNSYTGHIQRKMNWISITEKLPKEFENILFSDGDCVHAGWMVYKYDEKYPTFYESWEHEKELPLNGVAC